MAQHGLASSQVAALLECAYKLFVEHVVPAAAPDQAEASWHTALWSVLVRFCCRSTFPAWLWDDRKARLLLCASVPDYWS